MPVHQRRGLLRGLGEACRQEVQRFMFWSCMLERCLRANTTARTASGRSHARKTVRPSPHGMAWGIRRGGRYQTPRLCASRTGQEASWTLRVVEVRAAPGGSSPLVEGELHSPLRRRHPRPGARHLPALVQATVKASNAARVNRLPLQPDERAEHPSAGEARKGGNWPLPLPTLPILPGLGLVLEGAGARKGAK